VEADFHDVLELEITQFQAEQICPFRLDQQGSVARFLVLLREPYRLVAFPHLCHQIAISNTNLTPEDHSVRRQGKLILTVHRARIFLVKDLFYAHFRKTPPHHE
jgi:hypothetical protein